MNIYVYQIGDSRFKATMAPEFPGGGRVVETWPVNNKREIDFVAKHGSAFGDVTHKVHELADEAARLLKENKVYTLEEQEDLFRQNDLEAWAQRLKLKEHKLDQRRERLKASEQRLSNARNHFDRWRQRRTDELYEQCEKRKELKNWFRDLERRELLVSNRELQASKREGSLDLRDRHLRQLEANAQRKIDEKQRQQDMTRRLLHAQSENLVRRELRVNDFMNYLKRHPVRAGLRMIFRRKL